MDDGVGAGGELAQRRRGPRGSPATQVDPGARRLLAAGERGDLMPGGERGLDQMRADKAGAAGDRDPQAGEIS